MEKQIDSRDCSLHVLSYFYKYLKFKEIDLNDLKLSTKYYQEGININDYQKLCNDLGLDIEIYNCDIITLQKLDKDQFPVAGIINNGQNMHMIVIEKYSYKGIKVYDPTLGTKWYKPEEFNNIFKNVVIEFNKSNIVSIPENVKTNKINWSFSKYSLFYLLMLLFEATLLFLIPYFNKIMLDKVIPNKLYNHLIYLFIIFIAINLFSLIIKLLFKKVLEKIIMYKTQKYLHTFVTSLKINNQKQIANLSSLECKNRLYAITNIAHFEVTFIADVFSSILTFILALILLWNINLILMLTVGLYSLINLLIGAFSKSWYNNCYPIILNNQLSNDQHFNNYYSYIQNIHCKSLEQKLFVEFWTSLKSLNNKSIKFKYVSINLESVSYFLDTFFPMIVLVLGCIQIWNQKLNTIDLIFFLTGVSLFTRPVKMIIPLINSYTELQKSLLMLNYFNFDKNKVKNTALINSPIKHIKLTSVLYSYTSNLNQRALSISNFIIDSNIRLIGANGSGKTTLCGILSGSKQYDDGAYYVNEQKINPFYDLKYQQQTIYLGSKMDLNIALNQYLEIETINQFANLLNSPNLLKVAKRLNLYLNDDLNINNLSSGQKQFIQILKVLIHDYSFVILDEAFEQLDTETFELLKQELLNKLQKSLVVEISHNSRYLYPDSKVVNVQDINKIV
ncbi:Mbov_0121 family peptidase domain-containing ABC transporter [Mycoplasma nasistruthionis]|uniref:ATP-binding cassette domain-containing protein n=1 Tax=Mycoplasma nasistruthionis TaxID=353852 RepID=A0A4Y6I6E4_9MOLU|nr:cysteine peptidase family C39 domain-containing protein [Mycoplasma nasistruthionis]QDF64941.1 ATP-binding cassette domain-containing protein [Mycoplasma nasistruthionis]